MTLIGFISTLVQFTLFCIGVVLFVFALIGIGKVYSDYKESKWQKEHGNKLQEDAERNQWETLEQLRDRIFLLEETINKKGIKNSIDKINKIISDLDYDARYNTWKIKENKWKIFAMSSMSGGFGSTERAQAEISEDFDEYEKQRIQELRVRLDKLNEKGR